MAHQGPLACSKSSSSLDSSSEGGSCGKSSAAAAAAPSSRSASRLARRSWAAFAPAAAVSPSSPCAAGQSSSSLARPCSCLARRLGGGGGRADGIPVIPRSSGPSSPKMASRRPRTAASASSWPARISRSAPRWPLVSTCRQGALDRHSRAPRSGRASAAHQVGTEPDEGGLDCGRPVPLHVAVRVHDHEPCALGHRRHLHWRPGRSSSSRRAAGAPHWPANPPCRPQESARVGPSACRAC